MKANVGSIRRRTKAAIRSADSLPGVPEEQIYSSNASRQTVRQPRCLTLHYLAMEVECSKP